jgi:hypothetical protein
LLGIALLSAGCEKSATTGPGKPGDETYGKKLVGVWEGSEDFGGKSVPFTVEFMADNGLKMSMGPPDEKEPLVMTGTWKLVKEEGKTVTIETELALNVPEVKEKSKPSKKTLTVTFDDANNITTTQADKPESKKLKRKS